MNGIQVGSNAALSVSNEWERVRGCVDWAEAVSSNMGRLLAAGSKGKSWLKGGGKVGRLGMTQLQGPGAASVLRPWPRSLRQGNRPPDLPLNLKRTSYWP